MATHHTADFLAGVIEGFYGTPWSPPERLELFDWMGRGGLNTYLYAPKDDLKHRTLWRELYLKGELAGFAELIQACRQRKLHFIYAVSPGLDIRYSDASDLERLQERCGQLLDLGVRHFALLFDDIPDHLDPQDLRRWGSLAAAQASVVNEVAQWTRHRQPHARFLFCPTPYCDRMAGRKLGGEGYLAVLGQSLAPDIDVFYTGPEIISPEIPVSGVRALQQLLQRKPIIWDNLFANDYDGHRCFLGPYAGRPQALRTEVSGLLINPNCEFAINFVPIQTFAKFVSCDTSWNPRAVYLEALKDWHPRFRTVSQPITLEDLILFSDVYYLPFEDGNEAQSLYQSAQSLLTQPPAAWGAESGAFRERAGRLRAFCARLPELQDRSLFYALARRAWELREELDLFDRYVEFKSNPAQATLPFRSDSHLPGTYRGGLVARLQRLLDLQTDGTIAPPLTHPAPARNPPAPQP